MKKTISILSEEFENEQTGKRVEGINIMVDGALEDFLSIIKLKKPQYNSNINIIQDALMMGLEAIKNSIQ